MSDFRDNQQITELLDALEKNGMPKERQDVLSLVDYISDMEDTLTGMLEEMQGMKEEIGKIHNSTLRAKCQSLVEKTEGFIHKCFEAIGKMKDNLVQGAKSALEALRNFGVEAFKKVVHAMKIPEALDNLAGLFSRMSENVRDNAQQLKTMQSELNVGRAHIKNAGRLFTGRLMRDPDNVRTDKGILAGLGRLFEKMGKTYDSLAQKAMDGADKLRTSKVRESVRSELGKLTAIHGGRTKSQPEIVK